MIESLASNYLSSLGEPDAEMLIRALRCEEMYYTGMKLGEMLLRFFPHSVGIADEYGLCTYYTTGGHAKAYTIFQHALDMRGITQNQAKHLLFNQHFCIHAAATLTTGYNPSIVATVCRQMSCTPSLPQITLTMTSCKRFDLFEVTVNSFLNCCRDLHKIDRWICIDDNSSEEDRVKMQTQYPFFEFYMKTLEQKGHPQSMNMIRTLVKTPYFFHMEDDFHFFCERNYISDCLDVIGSDHRIRQCAVNQNYAEIPENINILGGDYKQTNTGLRYYIHEQVGLDLTDDEWTRKHGCGMSSNYWPHFTFRPALTETAVLHELGSFDEGVSHFERIYADEYARRGFKTAFFEGIYCLHTGRLTSEIHDDTKLNAYKLNGEAQFQGKEAQVAEAQVAACNIVVPTYVINLARRPDRWDTFVENASGIKSLAYNRVLAIDGSNLEPTLRLQRIFDNNDYNMRRGMVGCAMSHLSLYIALLKTPFDAFCILEDDVEFTPRFDTKLQSVCDQIQCIDWDMVYLGHHLREEYINDESYDKTMMPRIEKWDRHTSLARSLGGTGGYLISRPGIEKLLTFIEKTGMTNGIDTVQQKAADDMNIIYVVPHLIYSECVRKDHTHVDSDIQRDYSSLTMEMEERKAAEIDTYDRDVVDYTGDSMESMRAIVTNQTVMNVSVWSNDDPGLVVSLARESVHPCYTLNDKVLFMVPGDENRCARLKLNGEWFVG